MKVLLARVGRPGPGLPDRRGKSKGTSGLLAAWLGSILVVSIFAGNGCAHYPLNAPLSAGAAGPAYRFSHPASPTNSDELLLLLAFSGGGMRSSAVAYGVLQELAHTEVGPLGQRHPLTAEVDAVSGVSGGTFPAASFAFWGDRFFSDFEPQFLKRKIENGLGLRTLGLRNRIRLFSPTFNLSDLAAEYYDQLLFNGATYGDLAALPGRPFLLINAIDLGLGERFRFTQDQFDLIGSDLAQLPLCRAVAAGVAFPGLLSPIVLKNYSSTCPRAEPEWIGSVLADPNCSSEQKYRAHAARSYCTNAERRPFIHLLDGGPADDLGLRNLAEVVLERYCPQGGSAQRGPAQASLQKVRRIAVIIVDAEIGAESDIDARENPPQLAALVSKVLLTMIRRYSRETVEQFADCAQRVARDIETARNAAGPTRPFAASVGGVPAVSLYTVALHFGRLADEADRRYFNSVPTRLQLPSESIDRLVQLARKELARNEAFRRLVSDLRQDQVAASSK